MIELTNVTFGYSSRRRIYDGLSLRLDGGSQGSVCGLLGGNGAGKSTLLKLASGLLKPQKGAITIDGANPTDRSPKTYRKLMVVPEEFDLPATTVERFTRTTAPFWPTFSHEGWRENLRALQVDPSWHFRRMSMGERKKAYLAFALAACTPCLLMDEPTNGLDIPGKSALRRLLSEATTPGRLIVISTHQARDVENLLDRVVILGTTGVAVDARVADIEGDGHKFDLEQFYIKNTTKC